MKKILISLVIVVAFGLYLWFHGHSEASLDVALPTDSGTPAPTSTSTNGATVTPNTGTSAQGTSGLKDGTYASAVFDAEYGSMQVQITIANGKIADVGFLQYPNSAGHTTEVSNRALPILKSEATAAQSSNVDIVSGATQTSEAFIKALASALVKART